MTEKQQFQPTIDPVTATVQDMFTKVLQDRIQSGVLEEAITKQVDKLIASSIDDALSNYSEVGKALRGQLKDALTPNLEQFLDLPTYHQFVMQRLKMAAQAFYDERLAKVLDDEIKSITEEIPAEVKLSDLLAKVSGVVRDDEAEEEGQITLFIENDRGVWCHVYIDKKPNQPKYRCAYQLDMRYEKDGNKWVIYNAKIDDNTIATSKLIGPFYNFEKLMMHLFAMKSAIVFDHGFDADDYTTSWCDYE